jgi:hypothetical protein
MADYIRRANQEISLSLEQTMEMARLMRRPTGLKRFTYYCDINTSDGPVNFAKVIKPYQFEMLDLFQNSERSILLASRQMSKCVKGNSIITVRNDLTGEIMEFTIKEFHDMTKH